MENNRGTTSHFIGIIRIVALIILIAIIAFFIIRWARARQDTNQSRQADTSKQANRSDDDSRESGASNQERRSSASSENESPQDSRQVVVGGSTADTIPQVGPQSIVMTMLSIITFAYVFARYADSRRTLRHTQSMVYPSKM